MCLTKTEGYVVTLAENMEVVIHSLELTTEDWKHMSVGAGGRGGVLLTPLDTDIPVAIHPTIATPLTTLKMAPLNRPDNYLSHTSFL